MPLELSDKTFIGSPEQVTKENLHNLKIDKIIIAESPENECNLPNAPEIQEKIIRINGRLKILILNLTKIVANEMKRQSVDCVKDKRVLIICNKGTEWSLVLGVLMLKMSSGSSREACLEKVKLVEPNFILGKAHYDIMSTF